MHISESLDVARYACVFSHVHSGKHSSNKSRYFANVILAEVNDWGNDGIQFWYHKVYYKNKDEVFATKTLGWYLVDIRTGEIKE